jgi:hypothetical protein
VWSKEAREKEDQLCGARKRVRRKTSCVEQGSTCEGSAAVAAAADCGASIRARPAARQVSRGSLLGLRLLAAVPLGEVADLTWDLMGDLADTTRGSGGVRAIWGATAY